MNHGTPGDPDHHAHFAGFKVRLPRSRVLRLTLGLGLIVGGMFGFLPILGFWMLPLGIIVLAADIPAARALIHWVEDRWYRWRNKAQKKGPGG